MKRIVLCVMILSLACIMVYSTGKTETTGGQKIVVGMEEAVHSDAFAAIAADYKAKTGVTVEIQKYPYSGWVTQVRTEAASKTGLFDLIYISGAVVGENVKADYIVPFESFDAGKLNIKNIPFYDLWKQADGKHYLLPWFQEPNTLLVRQDLLDDPAEIAAFKKQFGYELTYPKTEAQYLDQLKFFTRPDKGLYGAIIYGKRAVWNQIHFQHLLHARGLSYLDWKTLQPYMSTPPVQQALNDWKALFQYADPVSLDADWNVGNTNWKAGRAYSLDTWGSVFLYSNDQETSKIVGKVAMIPYPTELKRVVGFAVQQGLAITKTAKNPKLVFDFLSWATSPANHKKAVLGSKLGNIPASLVTLEDPEVNKRFPMKKLVELLSTTDVMPAEPPIPEGRQINLEILTTYLSRFLVGELTAEETGRQFDDQINELLKKGNYPTPWIN